MMPWRLLVRVVCFPSCARSLGSDGPNESLKVETPVCSCEGSSFAPDESNERLAPFTSGCVTPLVAQNLSSVANEVVITHIKRRFDWPASARTDSEVTLRVTGTEWELNRFDWLPWSAATVDLSTPGNNWLRVTSPRTGNVTRPQIIGEDSITSIPFFVTSVGLAERNVPYDGTMVVNVSTPSCERFCHDLQVRLETMVASDDLYDL